MPGTLGTLSQHPNSPLSLLLGDPLSQQMGAPGALRGHAHQHQGAGLKAQSWELGRELGEAGWAEVDGPLWTVSVDSYQERKLTRERRTAAEPKRRLPVAMCWSMNKPHYGSSRFCYLDIGVHVAE